MEETFIFHPKGTCSREMLISYDGDTITDLKVIGGCHGNLQGIAALVKGRKIEEVCQVLSGIDCHGRGTSCPDQLAKALKQIEEKNQESIS